MHIHSLRTSLSRTMGSVSMAAALHSSRVTRRKWVFLTIGMICCGVQYSTLRTEGQREGPEVFVGLSLVPVQVTGRRCSYPGAVLFLLRSAPLEDLQLDNVEGQQSQGEAAHAACARAVTGTFYTGGGHMPPMSIMSMAMA